MPRNVGAQPMSDYIIIFCEHPLYEHIAVVYGFTSEVHDVKQ